MGGKGRSREKEKLKTKRRNNLGSNFKSVFSLIVGCIWLSLHKCNLVCNIFERSLFFLLNLA